jgi:nicotinamidase-related amidase
MNYFARIARTVIFSASMIGALHASTASAQTNPGPVRAEETAIILIDFQANFTSPDGAWYSRFKKYYDETKMLERTVDLVKQARAKGVLVVHVTEGYTQDYRELDQSNPGGFHRGQLARQAWKIGSPEAAYYEPLRPGPKDGDLFLAPRIQVSGFGGTGLNEILRSKGIKNIAVAGYTADVCVLATILSGYDLGYHVYALSEAIPGFFEDMAKQMVTNVYPMWSTPVKNTEFLALLDQAKATQKP